MPTHITQIDDNEHQRTVLRVEGEMMLDDALLLERIASDIQTELDTCVTIDLAELDLLDSEAAAVLRRMDQRVGLRIEGMEMFLQTAVNAAEKQAGGL
jgi:anti-anti-sigma regulatory factor